MARFTGENADIFDAGAAGDDVLDAPQPATGQPPAPVENDDLSDDLDIPVSADDAAVSEAIRNLSRGHVPTPVRAPAIATTPQPQPVTPPAEPEDKTVAGLMRAMLDERSKRQDAEARLRTFDKPAQPAAAPEIGDRLFTEPDAVLNEMRAEISGQFGQQVRSMQINYDLQLASIRYAEGDAFKNAWSDWYASVSNAEQPNPELYHLVMSSPSPGEALMQWHRNKTQADEIGGDLGAYKAKVIREAFEQAGLPVPPQFGGAEPRNDVHAGQLERDAAGRFTSSQPQARRFPTPTSRMGQSGNGMHERDEDGSDAAIFDSGKPKRSRDD